MAGLGLGLVKNRRKGALNAFDRLKVSAATWALWPANRGGQWQERAGTGAVTADAQPVGRIVDEAGSGRDMIAQSDDRRALSTDGLTFDGVNDNYRVTGAGPAATTIVFLLACAGDDCVIISDDGGGSTAADYCCLIKNSASAQSGAASTFIGETEYPNGSPRTDLYNACMDGVGRVMSVRGLDASGWAGFAFGAFAASINSTSAIAGVFIPIAVLDEAAADYADRLADALEYAASELVELGL